MDEKKEKKIRKPEWTFAHARDFDELLMLSSDDPYKEALNLRGNKRDMYNKAINAALENLMSWERVIRADGFKIILGTDIHQGAPHLEFTRGEPHFVQAYGAMVVEDD